MNFTQTDLNRSKLLQAYNTKQIKNKILSLIAKQHPTKPTWNFMQVWVDNYFKINTFVVDIDTDAETILDLAIDVIEEHNVYAVVALFNQSYSHVKPCPYNTESPLFYESILPGNHVRLGDKYCYTWNELRHMASHNAKRFPMTNEPFNDAELGLMEMMRSIPSDQLHLLRYKRSINTRTKSKSRSKSKTRRMSYATTRTHATR